MEKKKVTFKKPNFKGFVKGLVKGLVREGLQSVPIIGTFVTNWKTNTPQNPQGKIKLGGWDFYRLIIGIGAAFLMAKNILTQEQIHFIWSLIGIN